MMSISIAFRAFSRSEYDDAARITYREMIDGVLRIKKKVSKL